MINKLLLALERMAAQAHVASVHTDYTEVVVDGWPRPHTTLRLVGPKGAVGRGEYIGWTPQDHTDFAADPRGQSPYARCAFEAASIDLAMRQGGHSLCSLVGCPSGAQLTYAVSFDASANARERAVAISLANPGVSYKIDAQHGVDYRGIPVAVLDFKGQQLPTPQVGPSAILEDPPELARRAPWARDKPILSAADVQDLGTHLNLKAPRMGGFLEALRAAARGRELGLELYWGGMFEVGVGRSQAQQLAAIVCPTALNDLAPISPTETDPRGPRPLRVALDQPGFGLIT